MFTVDVAATTKQVMRDGPGHPGPPARRERMDGEWEGRMFIDAIAMQQRGKV